MGLKPMADRLKVLHIITRLILGGAQENTLFTVEGLNKDEYEVTLATGPAIGHDVSTESTGSSTRPPTKRSPSSSADTIIECRLGCFHGRWILCIPLESGENWAALPLPQPILP